MEEIKEIFIFLVTFLLILNWQEVKQEASSWGGLQKKFVHCALSTSIKVLLKVYTSVVIVSRKSLCFEFAGFHFLLEFWINSSILLSSLEN